MYLRTPKRYSRGGQKKRVFNLRWLWLWLITPVIVVLGLQIYNHRALFIPVVDQWMNERLDEAQQGMATAMAPTPLPTEDPRARRQQADDSWRLGAIEQATRIYQEILPALPNDVVVHYQVTLGLLINGRFGEALAAAERTVNANPFSTDAWAIRALALERSGFYGESIASAMQALALEPNNARALAFMAEAYFDIGQIDRALSTVERALEIDPNSFEAYRVRGVLNRFVRFDFAAAIDDFETAYDLAPNLIYPAFDLVEMYYTENYEQALELLRPIIDLNPGNTIALFWMGRIYFRQVGDNAQASDYLQRCIDTDARNILCNYELGRVQGELLDYSRSAELFRAAIAAGSRDPFHWYWAGYSQILLGNCPAALPYLQQGYQLALDSEIIDLYDLYENGLRDCQAPGFVSLLTPTPGAEATAEGG
ncbi:MAG: tetratricopeptide repeat protein [Chloroflexi bacterium]|nr:tetratricopeptide repeat protein [Chloroflexota bacterium]